MVVATAEVYLHAGWVHLLKEKRMVVKSIIDKVKHKFNVSIAEVDDQDLYQSIVIGIACVSSDIKHAQKTIQDVIEFIEDNTDAMIINIMTEIR